MKGALFTENNKLCYIDYGIAGKKIKISVYAIDNDKVVFIKDIVIDKQDINYYALLFLYEKIKIIFVLGLDDEIKGLFDKMKIKVNIVEEYESWDMIHNITKQ